MGFFSDEQWEEIKAAMPEEGAFETPDYSGFYDRIRAAQAEQNRIAGEQLGIAERQADIADERYAYYQQYFEPLQDTLIQKAKVGVDEAYAADLAQNKTEQGFRAARDAARREMERIGIDPNDPDLQSIQQDKSLNEMASVVNARNQARLRAEDQTYNLRSQVASMGRGKPAEAQSFLGAAAQGMQGAQRSMATGTGLLRSALSGQIQSGQQGLANQLQAKQFQSDLASQRQLENTMATTQGMQGLFGLGQTAMGYAMNRPQQQILPYASAYQTAPQMTPYQTYGTPYYGGGLLGIPQQQQLIA